MGLRFRRVHFDQIHAHCREGYPHEVVGILAGERSSGEVHEVASLLNERADSAHNRYQVSALALQKAERVLEGKGHEILGYYHSHPDHPADYSAYDRDHAWPNMSYLIVSVRHGAVAETKSWRLVEDRTSMDAEPITFEEAPMATIHVPTPLRAYTGGAATLSVQGHTVGEALSALTAAHPGLQKHLRDADGKLRSFVNVYVGDEDIRYLQQEQTPVADGTEITIVPSIAGGVA